MIISKTPLRISFAGGGTDLQEFYKTEPGSVISVAIDKYIYIAIHKFFNNKILAKYSQNELVDTVEDIKNTRIKACLKLLNITKGVEVTSMADIPSKTGLGSSSSFVVSLLHALHAFKGEHVSSEKLSQESCHIEIEVLKEPIGKQDQYAAAYGGLNYIEFHNTGRVSVTPIICNKEILSKLNQNLILFYTGIERFASEILHEQKQKTDEKRQTLRKMKVLSEKIRDALIAGNLELFAALLHEGWMEKKQVTQKISNPIIDEYYERAIAAGAKGGKLLGAGGGGCLLFYCERDKQDKVRSALKDLKEIPFNFDFQGSRIIHVGD